MFLNNWSKPGSYTDIKLESMRMEDCLQCFPKSFLKSLTELPYAINILFGLKSGMKDQNKTN